MNFFHLKIICFVVVVFAQATVFANNILITSHGVKVDGTTINTVAIQNAIDECTKTGGTVIVPAGSFVTGTLYLKNNVTLHLEKGAFLLGSTNTDDYPRNAPVSVNCGDIARI